MVESEKIYVLAKDFVKTYRGYLEKTFEAKVWLRFFKNNCPSGTKEDFKAFCSIADSIITTHLRYDVAKAWAKAQSKFEED